MDPNLPYMVAFGAGGAAALVEHYGPSLLPERPAYDCDAGCGALVDGPGPCPACGAAEAAQREQATADAPGGWAWGGQHPSGHCYTVDPNCRGECGG